MDTRLLDGRRLHLWLGTLLAAGAVACGGRTEESGDASVDGPVECVTEKIDTDLRCSSWTVTVLAGGRVECGFYPTGSGPSSMCSTICGSSADSCSWIDSASSPKVSCTHYSGCVVDGRRPEHLEAF